MSGETSEVASSRIAYCSRLIKIEWHKNDIHGYLRFMVEESCPSNLLLVASAKCVSPFACNIPTPFSLNDAFHLNPFEYGDEVHVCHST
jgi:hypothetical protein